MNLSRAVALILGIGMVTTLILPGRQTVGVINAAGTAGRRLLGTAMGTDNGG